ncbi:hypothetical protein FHU35_11185 [Saccharopolyspora dendranthemae]|uniref:Uncharacterized protein n=1 Tax=Saccharopolyspora dendranthemae TaxID=1181886 RepID=A0A561V7I9_9PSEU|nr:hypothetical protein FHU35_11185 [Saccharopolyspora dendranthemae]
MSSSGGPPQHQPVLTRGGSEDLGRGGHVQRLMRPLSVVFPPPFLHRLPGMLHIGERALVGEQFILDAAVPTLDLARRGGRADLGQQMRDPVVPGDPVEQHLRRARTPVFPGELFAVVGQDLLWHPVGLQRRHQRPAHRPRRRPRHHGCDDAEPRVIIDTGDQLAPGAVDQHHRAHDVHLPQLHRLAALPAPKVLPPPLPRRPLRQVMALEHPIDRRQRRHRLHPGPLKLEDQPARTPPRMLPPQLTHPRLDLGIQLPRMPTRPMRPILQTGQALIPIAANPGMHRLPRHAIPFRDLGDLRSSRQDLHDRVITLLHNAQLHEHRPRPPTRRTTIAPKSNRGRQCYPSNEHRVSPIKRSST